MKITTVCKLNQSFRRAVIGIPPAFLAASAMMLLIDGTVSEVFFQGLFSIQGPARLICLIAFLLLLSICCRGIEVFRRDLSSLSSSQLKSIAVIQLSCVVVGCGLLPFVNSEQLTEAEHRQEGKVTVNSRPNILLLGGDGISAVATSLFGTTYHDTTPYLRSVKERGLFADNAFSSGCKTTNSLPALLSGKSPLETGVIDSPDIFRGLDSYQSLPHLLRLAGYNTISLTTPYITDPYHINMRDSFDEANYTTLGDWEIPFVPWRWQQVLQSHRLFLILLSNKLVERFLHILTIRYMFAYEVVRVEKTYDSDILRLRRLDDLINSKETPWFMHVHLLGTHGHRFFPALRKFSLDTEQHQDWMQEYYQDAILEFDKRVSHIFDQLTRANQLDNTLVVIYSDHGFSWGCERTPLMFFFPHGEHRGVIHHNVSHLDVAPTILDYLKQKPPDWMSGHSLLRGEPPESRLIQMASQIKAFVTPKPTLKHNLIELSVIECERRYIFNLVSQKYQAVDIPGHTFPCDPGEHRPFQDIQSAVESALVPRYLPTIEHRDESELIH